MKNRLAVTFVPISHEDSILATRIEFLAPLVDDLVEPVMVISSNFELVYANSAARQVRAQCPLLKDIQRDGLPPGPSAEPCENCLGEEALKINTTLSSSVSPKGQEAKCGGCPFHKSFPLSDKEKQVGCILLGGRTAKEALPLQQDRWDKGVEAGMDQRDPALKEFNNFLPLSQDMTDQCGVDSPALQKAERSKIMDALRATGSKEKAAQLLNVSLDTLYDKLRQYEILA